MVTPAWACAACGFVGPGLVPFSPEWHRQHRDAHEAAFPDLDQGSRDNLAMFIDRAEALSESGSRQTSSDCP